jgi:hypothetical protein
VYISDGQKKETKKEYRIFNVKLLENYTLGRGGKTILTQTLTEQTVTMGKGKTWINIGPHGQIWC